MCIMWVSNWLQRNGVYHDCLSEGWSKKYPPKTKLAFWGPGANPPLAPVFPTHAQVLSEDEFMAIPEADARQVLADSNQQRCPVCHITFEARETLRRLPACGHYYHEACIRRWLLAFKDKCPIDGLPVEVDPVKAVEAYMRRTEGVKGPVKRQKSHVQHADAEGSKEPGERAEAPGERQQGRREPRLPPPAPKLTAPAPKRRASTPKQTAPTPKRRAPTPKQTAPTPKRRAPTPKQTAPTPKRMARPPCGAPSPAADRQRPRPKG